MDVTSSLSAPPIQVVGIAGGWLDVLSLELERILDMTDVLVGGKRQLGQISDAQFTGSRLVITRGMDALADEIAAAREAGRRVTVLASGDPLCYGIGGTLRRYFSAETLNLIPAPSAYQLAFARVAEPWQDAELVSAHGRPAEQALTTVMTSAKTAVLTDMTNTPAVLAQCLLKAGIAPESRCVVCERLGAVDERVVDATVAAVAEQAFDKLNVMLVWNDAPVLPQSPGIPDSMIEVHKGQITKREVRLAVLGEIGLRPGEVLWDIGSGSGSVAIEAARMVPTATVIAVEKSAEQVEVWQENVNRFGVFNVRLFEADAPDGLEELDAPNVVFVGGSGGRLKEIIEISQARLRDKGRIVAAFATFENLALARNFLPDATVYQVAVNRVKAVGAMERLAALNPVFILKWVKREEEITPRNQEAKKPRQERE